jgi:magnesium-transporting ATPase (P-type)
VTLPPPEQKNMLFMGTLATNGSARAIVVAIGNNTIIGGIAKELGKTEELITPLQESTASIARFLSYIILGAIVGIFVLGLLRGEPLTELILISIAVAIAAIPEGLTAAVTVVLAIGMEAILKRGGLVRNLLAAETLGSTTVILTDKTGTLTKADMRVARVITLGTIQLTKAHKENPFLEILNRPKNPLNPSAAVMASRSIEITIADVNAMYPFWLIALRLFFIGVCIYLELRNAFVVFFPNLERKCDRIFMLSHA